MAFYEKDVKRSEPTSEKLEDVTVERRGSTAEQVLELSQIEATAASRAAWLLSATVSLGGLLFGMLPHRRTPRHRTMLT